MAKKYCGRCPELDLSKPIYRYTEPYYRCMRYKTNKGTEEEPKWEYKVRKAHDVCLEIEVPVTIIKEEVKEVIKPKKEKKKKKIKEVFKAIEEKIIPKSVEKKIEKVIETIEETAKVGGLDTLKAFVPPDPIEEIIELTPEEKKAIRRQQLEAQIAELEAEE